MISGRQALWTVFQEYKLDEERGTLFDLTDLMAVRMKDDRHMEAFIDVWDDTVHNMKEPLPESVVEVLFFEQIKRSSVLASEVAEYNRAPRGDHRHSYQFLYDSAVRHVNRQLNERNRAAKLDHLRGKPTHGTPALPAKEARDEDDFEAALPAKDLPCYDFAKGKCSRGNECKYSHDLAAASARPKPKAKPKAKPKQKAITKEEAERRKEDSVPQPRQGQLQVR